MSDQELVFAFACVLFLAACCYGAWFALRYADWRPVFTGKPWPEGGDYVKMATSSKTLCADPATPIIGSRELVQRSWRDARAMHIESLQRMLYRSKPPGTILNMETVGDGQEQTWRVWWGDCLWGDLDEKQQTKATGERQVEALRKLFNLSPLVTQQYEDLAIELDLARGAKPAAGAVGRPGVSVVDTVVENDSEDRTDERTGEHAATVSQVLRFAHASRKDHT